jgi:HK97 family phage major capsid protein
MTATVINQTERETLATELRTLSKKQNPTPEETARLYLLAKHAEAQVGRISDARYRDVFSRYLLRGKLLSDDDLLVLGARFAREGDFVLSSTQVRDMESGQGAYPGSVSGFFAPVAFIDEVFRMLKSADRIFDPDVSRFIETDKGGPVSIPNVDDTSSAATIVSQGQQDVETEPRSLGQLMFLTCQTWRSGIIKVSVEFEDSAIPLEPEFTNEFGKRFARGIGSFCVAQLLSQAQQGAVAAGSSANDGSTATGGNSVGTADLHNLLASVNESYLSSAKAYWLMTFNTWQTLLQITDKIGRPIIHEMYNDRGEPLLFGKPVATCPSMPAIGPNNTPIAVGDFSRFIIRLVKNSLRVRRDDERWAETLQIGFQAFWRVDASLQMTSGADSPVKYLQNASS